MRTKFRFTQTALEAVECPPDKGKVRVRDTEVPSLSFVVLATGGKVYRLYKKIHGRPVEVRIGTFEECTVDQARRRAVELVGEYIAGRDPAAQRRQEREAATMGDLWTAYRSAVGKAPRTMSEDEGLWTRYLDPWKSRRLADITRDAVQRLYNRILAGEVDRESQDRFGHKRPIRGGASAARHTVKLLREMFNAMARTFAIAENPAKGIRLQKEATCDRYITPEEFPAFWAALQGQDELIRDALKLALFTGQRRSNLLAMRWEHVNLNFKTWTIPAAEMKSRRAHTVPLSTHAMMILERRRQADPDGEWVLNNHESADGHLVNPEKAIERIWKAAGIPAFSLHDLRRTTATWLNRCGANETTVQAALGHASRGVLGVYMQTTQDTLRVALQAMADAMMQAAVGPAAVTPVKAAG